MPKKPTLPYCRLGVNIDHAATLRNARGGRHPDPVRLARIAEEAGADGITAHLREDRRHIRDEDMTRLTETLNIPLNMEMAATPEMLGIALRLHPHACCIVPEKREELTTEGGLDVMGQQEDLFDYVTRLQAEQIRVSLFIDPDSTQLHASAELGVECVELHTGRYCEAVGDARKEELDRLTAAATLAHRLGLECHGGHGLSFSTVGPIAALPPMRELNIGHFLIGEALLTGLPETIRHMRRLIDETRARP